MRWLSVCLVALGLAGCVSSLNNAQASCSQDGANFSAMWDCIRGRVAAGQAGQMNNEMGVRYMAFGDVLNERYRQGQITNAEARLLLSQELTRANSEFDAKYARPASAAVGGAVAAAAQGYGNALQAGAAVTTCTTTPYSSWVGGPVSSVRTNCY